MPSNSFANISSNFGYIFLQVTLSLVLSDSLSDSDFFSFLSYFLGELVSCFFTLLLFPLLQHLSCFFQFDTKKGTNTTSGYMIVY